MKIYILFILLLIVSFSCNRDWNNPLEIDEDLKNTPEIIQIKTNSDLNIEIHLDYGYSDECDIILERKTIGGFSQISYLKQNQSTLLDTSLDKESNYDFIYRVRIKKNEYYTAYSDEETYNYVSDILYAPENLQVKTLELQGVQLSWDDISSKETGYKIEKDEGSGYSEIAALTANSESYLDEIAGQPETTLQLSYRVKACNSTLSSDWIAVETSYSGLGSPTNLQITDTTAFQFTIEWKDNSSIETGYSVERKKDDDIFKVVAELDENYTEYIDFITEIGFYSYRVQAQKDDLYSVYSNEVSFDIKTFVVVDIDGNVYKTVKIGNQWWMAENLKVTHYRNGDAIPNVTDNTAWNGLTSGAYCDYNNISTNADIYGRLYNWYAVNDGRGIAPEGWHVPSYTEWQTFVNYLGGSSISGGKMKETGTDHWISPNTGATNESGFGGLPGGQRLPSGIYEILGYVGLYWSSSQISSSNSWWLNMVYNNASIYYGDCDKKYGISVRCIKD